MALFDKKEAGEYEVVREGDEVILRVNYDGYPKLPSIEDDPVCMSQTMDKLAEADDTTKIVFYQKRDYEYDYNQTMMLKEIATLHSSWIKQKHLFSYHAMGTGPCTRCYDLRYAEIQMILARMLKTDPIGSYVELKRIRRREEINLEKISDSRCQPCIQKYISIIDRLLKELEKTKLIKTAEPHLAGYNLGDRSIYRRIFIPTIKPDFMFTKLMASFPVDGEELDTYTIGNSEITIFSRPGTVQYLYHVLPPEFTLDEEKYELLDLARKIMAEHKPKKSEFVDPQRMRRVFFNVGKDLIEELADYRKIKLKNNDLKEITDILVRYTIGFGLIEVLLQDEKIQDISINSPMGETPIFVVHQDFDDCVTNIVPVKPEAESWASKLRMISGRPFDEANPILDTELELPRASTRVAAITSPLNPSGMAFSFRRHRDKPWTQPLFIKTKMLTPLASGMLSFLIDGTRSMLIAGTRSSGKTSFLGSILVEIMRRYRIITVEDTLELPSNSLRNLGYNIQSLKVASALTKEGSEIGADIGIRATLRLGDSALIIGEVRSKEAISLYEAMRVGAAANVVAGTIHGDSPYGVYDRVVNDIGVPKTSFKATDVIIVANPVKSADGIHRFRRVTQITEVRKKWEEDPLVEGAFVDLMKYNVKTDQLEPTADLLNGDSEVLKTIAGNIKELAGNWDAVWENIQLRGDIKQAITDTALRLNDMEMLEAPFVIRCNDMYHRISETVKDEIGYLDSKRIMYDWNEWLKREIKKKNLAKNG